jgi:hypothetical protein
MSKGFLVSAGMMLPISEAGNSGSSKLPALCVCAEYVSRVTRGEAVQRI